MEPKKIKGILFDFDGVIAKTMEDNFNAWKAAMKDFGAELEEHEYYILEGMPLRDVAKKLCRKFNLDASLADSIVAKKENYYLKNHHFELYPGVGEIIDSVKKKKVSIGLVTAALPDRLKRSVPAEFLDKFDTIVSGDKVERGKPFPDQYLRAMSDLNLARDECIIIENAPLGIESAKAAGLYCIAICSTLDRSHLSKADKIIKEFKDLKKELGLEINLIND